jgi:hypothetical protein
MYCVYGNEVRGLQSRRSDAFDELSVKGFTFIILEERRIG